MVDLRGVPSLYMFIHLASCTEAEGSTLSIVVAKRDEWGGSTEVPQSATLVCAGIFGLHTLQARRLIGCQGRDAPTQHFQTRGLFFSEMPDDASHAIVGA